MTRISSDYTLTILYLLTLFPPQRLSNPLFPPTSSQSSYEQRICIALHYHLCISEENDPQIITYSATQLINQCNHKSSDSRQLYYSLEGERESGRVDTFAYLHFLMLTCSFYCLHQLITYHTVLRKSNRNSPAV